MESKTVRAHWEVLTADMSLETRETWWDVIVKAYTDDRRRYHTLDHLSQMFGLFEQTRDKLANPEAAAYAIFFHNAVYNSSATDNYERSAELFAKFAKDANISLESDLFLRATELILLIKAPLTEVHLTPDASGSEDTHYFLDYDLAMFGSSPEDYDNYTSNIRLEYDHLSDSDYKVLRLKVLQSFQHIPNIFATTIFRERFQTQARENINRECELLKKS